MPSLPKNSSKKTVLCAYETLQLILGPKKKQNQIILRNCPKRTERERESALSDETEKTTKIQSIGDVVRSRAKIKAKRNDFLGFQFFLELNSIMAANK